MGQKIQKETDIKEIKEFVMKGYAFRQSGYWMYKKLPIVVDGQRKFYFKRVGLIPESSVYNYKNRGLKLWSDLTEEEREIVDVFPDEKNTVNKFLEENLKRGE